MKRKIFSILFALVLVVSFSLVTAVPASAEPSIAIDGSLTPGEWDGATSFDLVPNGYTAYVTNDGEFMYVAFDYAVTTGSDFASFNVYKQGAFTPDVINAPNAVPLGDWTEVIDGVPGPPFETERLWDTITDDTPTDGAFTFAEWDRHDGTGRFVSAVNTATEMKVPLAELGFAPRDTIKMIFVLNEHMVNTHLYPVGASSIDPNTYATYSARVKNENTGFYFQTIQGAINVASDNDTISVGAGTYYESIQINKPLTIRSTDGAEETIIDGIAFRYMVDICSSDVTFEGFTVTNPTYAGGSDATGILIQSTVAMSNVRILDNIVTRVRSEAGDQSMYGATGINIGRGPLSDIVVSGNTITDIKNPEGPKSDHTCGINIWDGAEGVVISNNTISDIKYNGILLQRASNVLIENNPIITGCETGIRVEPFEEGAVSDVTINLNNFADNSIQVFDGAAVLDIEQVLVANIFDRAVVVRGSAIKVPTIFSSIQDAVNAAVTGDTVDVAKGTYDEVVAVDESVNLLGANADVCAEHLPGTRGDESIVNAFHITVNSVVVDGFQIEGAKVGGSGDATNAIVLDGGTSGHTISNNILPGPAVTPSSGRGIVFGYEVSDTTVSCNEICGWLSGIYINPTNPGSDLLFQYNTIHHNWAGIGSDGLNDVSIVNNKFIYNAEGFGSSNVGVNVGVHFNNFCLNTTAIAHYGGEPIVATHNWWDDVSGPAHAANPGGTGDPVTNNVTYSPWLGDPLGTEPMTFVKLVTSADPPPVTLNDEGGNPIATVDISGGNAAQGTIGGTSGWPDPPLTTLFVGTGKTGVIFFDIKITGYTSGIAHITAPYPDTNQDGFVDDTDPPIDETTLGLYYWDDATTMWLIAANNTVDTLANTVSGDIPVSALTGTAMGMGGYPSDEAIVAIESITDLSYSGNDTVALTIDTQTAQLGAATIDLTFDNTVVEVLGGENSQFDSLTVNPAFGPQTARFVANQLGPAGVDATGGAVLAQVRLKAVGNTGSSSPLELIVITLKDNDGIDIPVGTVTNGTATIGGLGDANSDGVVDVYDCVYIARAIAGIPGYIIDPVMDVSGDDTVDAWDCTYLARHLAGIPGYPLGG